MALSTHISLAAMSYGLPKDSVILLEQIRTLDKRRLKEKMGHLDEGLMDQVNTAIAVSFGLPDLTAAHPRTELTASPMVAAVTAEDVPPQMLG